SFAACPGDWYALYCRGGGSFILNINNETSEPNSSELIGKFGRNHSSFIARGSKYISPGSCAWNDRVIAEEEPTEFHLSILLTNMSTQLQMHLLTQCIPSSSCWMIMCAKNYGTGFLTILGGPYLDTQFSR
ncbi:MAG: hypothetical protein ACHQYQ_11490, partial [Bacteriovoracales bacterium]